MNAPCSFWSRTYSIRNGRVILNLYFGGVRVAELNTLLAEADAELEKIGVPRENLILTTNRAGMHLSNLVRIDEAAIEGVRKRLEAEKWKAASV